MSGTELASLLISVSHFSSSATVVIVNFVVISSTAHSCRILFSFSDFSNAMEVPVQ